MTSAASQHAGLPDLLRDTRARTLDYCASLQTEDYSLQRDHFVSPPKWHLAHTSWFFETFLLQPFLSAYQPRHPAYAELFNSYYNGVGQPFPRHQRGLLSRPSLTEVLDYRSSVDEAMQGLLAQTNHRDANTIVERTVLGIEHERQHQELFFTDIKYSLAANPMLPTFSERPLPAAQAASNAAPAWVDFAATEAAIGATDDSFAFDNELPQHAHLLTPFSLATNLVTNRDYQRFVDDGGYTDPQWWLADGWTAAQAGAWQAPLYWQDQQDMHFTLHGPQSRRPDAPVCHLSGYEAEAFARWAGARLPTEQEWEHAASTHNAERPVTTGLESGIYHPIATASGPGLNDMYGQVWQWTRSAYTPYPGFRIHPGAIGEYNGKFMSNQWVLRGGSCVSTAASVRPSYRNFFYPDDRWQFSGLRLARDL